MPLLDSELSAARAAAEIYNSCTNRTGRQTGTPRLIWPMLLCAVAG